MLFPLVPIRWHGWLDEFATLSYIGAAVFLGFQGAGFWLLVFAAGFHFLNTRCTDYPQGHWKVYSLTTHAKLELGEGLAVLTGAWLLRSLTAYQQITLVIFGISQLIASLGGDTRVPAGDRQQPV